MIRAIFFDVDGTLLSMTTHRIPASTLRALRILRRKGILLFVCTGRHKGMLRDVVKQFDFDGYLTVSGQHCTYRGELVYSNPIPQQSVRALIAAAAENGFSGIFLGQDTIYTNQMDDATEQFIRTFQVDVPPVLDMRRALTEPLYQVIVLLDKEHEGQLLDHVGNIHATRWHPTFLDVMAPGGGKGTGIAAVLRALNIPIEETMAFGDGENDIPMLELVGTGVAMGNAADTVKVRADYVTECVDDNGVSAALEYFGLI